MTHEDLMRHARSLLWKAWQSSSEELASQAVATLDGLGMLVAEGGAAELERLRSLLNAQPVALTDAQRDALADAGNRALNDHYHDDLCHCRDWPASCASSGNYFMGAWDTGAFDIGLGTVLGLWEAMRADRPQSTEVEIQSRELSAALAELKELRARVAELEAELAKYVGNEPTIAEEMAYLSRCLDAVRDVCNAAEKQATRWEQPLAVPEWVEIVRTAAGGGTVSVPKIGRASCRERV